MKRLFYLLLVFSASCSIEPQREITTDKISYADPTVQTTQTNLVYPLNGRIKKFFDENWNVVYDSAKAKFYRIASYENGQPIKTEKVYDYYISGIKQFEGFLSAESPDAPHGFCKWYDETGRLTSESNHQYGILEGKCTLYYPSGSISAVGNYSNNLLNGSCINYYPNGLIKFKCNYVKGILDGTYIAYSESGSITHNVVYKNGVKKEDDLFANRNRYSFNDYNTTTYPNNDIVKSYLDFTPSTGNNFSEREIVLPNYTQTLPDESRSYLNIGSYGTNPDHVSVDGHWRNGTYVEPHMRTAPNSTTKDNFSYYGNINPYTGKIGRSKK